MMIVLFADHASALASTFASLVPTSQMSVPIVPNSATRASRNAVASGYRSELAGSHRVLFEPRHANLEIFVPARPK